LGGDSSGEGRVAASSAPYGPFGSPRFDVEGVLLSLHQFLCTVMRPPASMGTGVGSPFEGVAASADSPPALTPAELSYRARAMPVRSCLAMLRDIVRHRGRDSIGVMRRMAAEQEQEQSEGGARAGGLLGSSLSGGGGHAALAAGMPLTKSSLVMLYARRFISLDQPDLARELDCEVVTAA